MRMMTLFEKLLSSESIDGRLCTCMGTGTGGFRIYFIPSSRNESDAYRRSVLPQIAAKAMPTIGIVRHSLISKKFSGCIKSSSCHLRWVYLASCCFPHSFFYAQLSQLLRARRIFLTYPFATRSVHAMCYPCS